ncbi:hypothetical protein MRB53_033906 [Persea americana]|uniref:Uncharacterized protein n=1 Tax=Persea americana TaxID=3435 RepID=A0ACC2KVS5_PERAE|nr:hypothetical protein MRB53_033906 [Persea americana]
MASLAAATAPASLGASKVLGSPLNVTSPARSAPTNSSSATFKVVALFSKKPPPKSKPVAVSSANEELAKWYGPDRRIFLPEGLLDRSEIPEYLNGEVPGDYGYDPFGLSKKPENFAKYQAYELIHARWAMLGAAGFIIPEAFNKFGASCGPEAVWFKTGALLLDGNTLNYFGKNIPINLAVAVVAEVVLLGGAEYYRLTNGLDLEDKLHPGGPFDPLGLANDPDQAAILKVKEIKNGRLAMFAMLGFFIQAYVTVAHVRKFGSNSPTAPSPNSTNPSSYSSPQMGSDSDANSRPQQPTSAGLIANGNEGETGLVLVFPTLTFPAL